MDSHSYHFWVTLAFSVGMWAVVGFLIYRGKLNPRGGNIWIYRSEDPFEFWAVISLPAAFAVFCTALFLYGGITGEYPAERFE
jgi:hypothetical protein